MPRRMRKPLLDYGPRQRFVDRLWAAYGQADYPALQVVSDKIDEIETAGTASHETIRRIMSRGDVPRRWSTADAIYVALCAMADPVIDPEGLDDDEDGGWSSNSFRNQEPSETRREIMHRLWRAAYEAPDEVPVGAEAQGESSSDGPPF